MTPKELTAIFGKFAGQELKNPKRPTCDVDSVLESMYEDAAKNKLTLRVIYPGDIYQSNLHTGRVNVYAEENEDGNLIVSNKFTIG